MQITTSDNFVYSLTRRSDGWVIVEGDGEAIEALVETITLAGSEMVPVGDDYVPSGVQVLPGENGPSNRQLALRDGTAALWLQFEVLNYL